MSSFQLTFDFTSVGLKPQLAKSGFRFLAYTLDALETLPSVQDTLKAIVESRRNGRPGYQPRILFRAFCLKYLLGERYTVGLIERLRASPRLREICGMERIPSESTFSRFFKCLADMPDFTDQAMAEMVERLRERLPDVGESVAVDSTDIEAYANPNRSKPTDTTAVWGVRTKKSKSGSKKDTEPFFGYKLHSTTDTVYGIPLAHILLPANQNDSPQLSKLVNKAYKTYRWFKPAHLLADRGYDSQDNHQFLFDRGITPIIHIRKPTANDGLYDGFYNAKGQPVCGDGKTPMEYVGTNPRSGKHLFRCPPNGCALKSRSSGAVRYCDTTALWLDPSDNLRVLGVVYRASSQWKRLYNRRQVIERMFGSMKQSRILNRHQYVQRNKIELHVGMSVLTYLTTMFTRVDAGDMDKIRYMRVKTGWPLVKNEL